MVARRSRGVLTVVTVALAAVTSRAADDKTPADILALWAVEREVYDAQRVFDAAYNRAKAPDEKRAAQAANRDKHLALAAHCLRVADQHSGTIGGLSALLLAAQDFPTVPDGKAAAERFRQQVATADLTALADALDAKSVFRSAEVARALLDRAEQSAGHPRTGRLLAAACVATEPNKAGEEPSAVFDEAVNRIVSRYPDSPDIRHLGEVIAGMGGGAAEPWAARYLSQLRAVVEKNPNREVRCTVSYALAAATRAAGDEAAAEKLLERYLAEFDGKTKYHFQGIEQQYRQTAERELAELRQSGVGKPAPSLEGLDLDGQPLKLSDYRGKVVLVSFWATWCGPCMRLVPHERELAERLAGKPFALVGVNGDKELEAAKVAVEKNGITWRSFRDRRPNQDSIRQAWHIGAWPTLYLIDHTGTVRRRWVGTPVVADLDRSVDDLLAKAGGP